MNVTSDLFELGGSQVLWAFRILIVYRAYLASQKPENLDNNDYKVAIIVGLLALVSSILIQ